MAHQHAGQAVAPDARDRVVAAPWTLPGAAPCHPIAGPDIHASLTASARPQGVLPVPRPLESIEMIRRLVAMDTTSRNSNLEIIGFIADHLAGFGIEGRLVHDESGRKANLYATLGPTDKPGIALSGHKIGRASCRERV